MQGLTDLLGQLAERLGVTVEQIWAFWIPYCQEKAVIDWDVFKVAIFISMAIVVALYLVGLFLMIKERSSDSIAVCLILAISLTLTLVVYGLSAGPALYRNKRLAQSQPKGYAMEQLIKNLK